MTHHGRDNPDGNGPDDLRDRRDQRWIIYLSAIVATTGIQAVVPALPALQDDLALSDSQLSLVTSAYLFPSVPTAFVSGLLADRVGRRFVYSGSLLLFGVAGTLVPVFGGLSFPLLLMLRVVQGIGFAGILPMTVTMIGDMFSGTTQIRVQGHRSVAMQIGDAGLPVLGGLLATVSWRIPFFGATVAIILAGTALWRFPAAQRQHGPATVSEALRHIPRFLHDMALVSLQFIGFIRFVLKFAVLSYLPVLAVNEKGVSALVASSALGLAAVAAGMGALLASRLASTIPSSWLLASSTCTLAVALVGIGSSTGTISLIVSAIVYGSADGTIGVLLNSMVAQAVPGESRATFVSLNQTIRNLGKFIGPVMAAGVALVASLSQGFALAGLLALLALAVVPWLGRFDKIFGERSTTDGVDTGGHSE